MSRPAKAVLVLLAVAAAVPGGSGYAKQNAPPQETGQPTLSGTFIEGRTVETSNGSWSNSPTRFSYRWLRCDRQGANCNRIGSANQNSYRLSDRDVGGTVLAHVTACNADGCTTANTKPSPVISGSRPPQATDRPSISGTAEVGRILTATVGRWSGAPTSFSFQWQRCDARGDNCASIADATASTYQVRNEDSGRTLRVVVVARNLVGSGDRTSAAVRVGPAAPVGPPGQVRLANGQISIPVTSVSLPQRLIISEVVFSPNVVRSRQTVISIRVKVVDTRGFVVRDALVFIRSVPLHTSQPPETVTGMDGTVTFQVLPKATFPLGTFNVQFFVRARKAGDNILAGVTTGRLVQVRTARG